MKSNQLLKLSILGALLLSIASTFQCGNQVGGLVEASRIIGSDTEYHQQPSQLPQTDPELDLASLKQKAPAASPPLDFGRHQRSVNYNQQQQQQAVQYPLHLTNQRLFEDEHALRHQLPELVAQAHNDKNVERALLRMLINASLRSNNQQQSAGAYNNYNNGRLGGDYWQSTDIAGDGRSSFMNNYDGGASSSNSYDFNAPMSRMAFGTVLDGGNGASNGGLDPLASGNNDMLVQSYAGQQDFSAYQAPIVDKREYIKPCSFNAVSCAKNPFRRF